MRLFQSIDNALAAWDSVARTRDFTLNTLTFLDFSNRAGRMLFDHVEWANNIGVLKREYRSCRVVAVELHLGSMAALVTAVFVLLGSGSIVQSEMLMVIQSGALPKSQRLPTCSGFSA